MKRSDPTSSTDMRVEFKSITAEEELAQAFSLREEVFVREQAVPVELELDASDRDAGTLHFVALADGKTVATARLIVDGEEAKVGRMAVRQKYRGQGVGAGLMEFIERTAAEQGVGRLVLASQEQAMGFYRKLGFREYKPAFDDARICHTMMEKMLG